MIREFRSPTDSATAEPPQARSRKRDDIDSRYKWNLSDIFPDWSAWEASYAKLDAGIDRYAALKGTLSEGPSRLLSAFELSLEPGEGPAHVGGGAEPLDRLHEARLGRVPRGRRLEGRRLTAHRRVGRQRDAAAELLVDGQAA